MIPRIDVFKCDGCGACVKRCPAHVMGLIKNKAALLVDLCEECGICVEACPIHAIHFHLPNKAIEQVDKSYVSPRVDRPTPGNWRVGVPRGWDGEGHYKE